MYRTKQILIIEDEPGLVMTLGDRLRSEGYLVEIATDGEAGLKAALSAAFDLLIVDLMIPKVSGLNICRKVRGESFDMPILILTARGEVVDKVMGFQAGADDYLTKPFEMAELLARVEALLRRAPARKNGVLSSYRFGSVVVDFKRAEVRREGERVALSAREYQLLQYLIEHRGTFQSRTALLRHVWDYDSSTMTRTVDVHILTLRKKLEENPKYPEFFVTVRGLGYKFTG